MVWAMLGRKRPTSALDAAADSPSAKTPSGSSTLPSAAPCSPTGTTRGDHRRQPCWPLAAATLANPAWRSPSPSLPVSRSPTGTMLAQPIVASLARGSVLAARWQPLGDQDAFRWARAVRHREAPEVAPAQPDLWQTLVARRRAFGKSLADQGLARILWRRGRDSNPRWAFGPYSLSRGAPSAARPPLHEDAAQGPASPGRAWRSEQDSNLQSPAS